MEINKTKRLKNLQFYPTVNEKTMIFLHHTAGMNADGAISWWNQTPDVVGVAYVIDRDGTIYEVFDPKMWAYHLGLKTNDKYADKDSIGIEIVSAGGLYLENGKYMFYPLYPNKAAGKEIPKEDVWDMGEAGWRGYRYFHKYTDEQIKSTLDLVQQLVKDFGIKVQPNLVASKFWEFNEDVFTKHLPGIWSHTSVRTDKCDIVPYPDFLNELVKLGASKPEVKETKVEDTNTASESEGSSAYQDEGPKDKKGSKKK